MTDTDKPETLPTALFEDFPGELKAKIEKDEAAARAGTSDTPNVYTVDEPNAGTLFRVWLDGDTWMMVCGHTTRIGKCDAREAMRRAIMRAELGVSLMGSRRVAVKWWRNDHGMAYGPVDGFATIEIPEKIKYRISDIADTVSRARSIAV